VTALDAFTFKRAGSAPLVNTRFVCKYCQSVVQSDGNGVY